MTLETERLILRPWQEADAEALYPLAKNPEIGPAAGWPVHTSVENSRQIIHDLLATEGSFAVILKDGNRLAGSIGLMGKDSSNLSIAEDEAEIGYWMGRPFWGNGYIPEAANELIRYSFENLALNALWCGYFDGNEKSRRAQEKCGFSFHHTEEDKPWPLINAVKRQHITQLTKAQWAARQEGTS